VLHHIAPSLTLHQLTARLSILQTNKQCGSCTAPYSATPVYTQWNKGQGTNPILCCTPCTTDTNHHTWRRHQLTNVSTKLSFTHQAPPSLSPHNNNSLFIYSIWFTEQTLSLGEQTHLNWVTLLETWKMTLQPTTYHTPAAPWTLAHH